MRLLVLTQHFTPEENAPAFRWSWLASGFGARGVDVDVITAAWSDLGDTVSEDGRVHAHRVGNTLKGSGLGKRLGNELLVALKSLSKAFTLRRPDVIIVTAPPVGAMLYTLPLSWLLRCPVVLEVRDVWPELFDDYRTWSDYGDGPAASTPRTLLAGAATKVLRPIMMFARRHTNMVVTTSESFAERARAQGHPNVVCVRNGAAERTPMPHRQFDGVLNVLYLGNLGRAQYLATAIRAAALVKEAGHEMQLRLVGHGAHEQALRRLAVRLDAPVEILPTVPRSEIDAHYAWADSILVMLRDWKSLELTVPSKLYEVIRTGKHVTGSVAGESAELIEASGAGDTVPPQDPEALAKLWISLIENPDLLRTSGNIDDLVSQTNLERLTETYLEALKRLARP